MQRLDDIDPVDAEDALVRLAVHVPADVPIGRPITVQRADPDDPDELACFLTVVDGLRPHHVQTLAGESVDNVQHHTPTVWWSSRGTATRMVVHTGGLAEFTTWAYRVQTAHDLMSFDQHCE
jgi:hypothetical protein